MNFDQLEAFIYVSSTGSFSKTAEILFLSQPTVSSKIKALEKELGILLFERNTNNIYLSKEGQIFLPYAHEIMNNVQKAQVSVRKMNNQFDGEILISVVFSGTNYIFPKIVKEFNNRYPKIKLVVYTGHSDQVLDMVLNREVPLGIVRSIYHPKVKSIRLMTDEMILVFHPKHPFNTLKKVGIEDLAQTSLILFKRETLDWTLINNAFKQVNLDPNITVEVDSVEGAKQMVKEKIGVSILPKFSVAEELDIKSLKTVPMEGIPKIQRDFHLIFLKENSFEGVTKLFKNFTLDKFVF